MVPLDVVAGSWVQAGVTSSLEVRLPAAPRIAVDGIVALDPRLYLLIAGQADVGYFHLPRAGWRYRIEHASRFVRLEKSGRQNRDGEHAARCRLWHEAIARLSDDLALVAN